jgi:hypothetical protein
MGREKVICVEDHNPLGTQKIVKKSRLTEGRQGNSKILNPIKLVKIPQLSYK